MQKSDFDAGWQAEIPLAPEQESTPCREHQRGCWEGRLISAWSEWAVRLSMPPGSELTGRYGLQKTALPASGDQEILRPAQPVRGPARAEAVVWKIDWPESWPGRRVKPG